MTGIEGVGFAIELFVISFSFLCWLVTPATQNLSTSQEVQNCEQEPERVQETFRTQEEQPQILVEDIWQEKTKETIEQPSQNSELNELQNELGEILREKIALLSHKEVRGVAKILRIKQYEEGRNISKAELAKRIKRFVESVALQEEKLQQITEYLHQTKKFEVIQ